MTAAQELEIWGGIECSYVRIGAEFRDQLAATGHWERDGDIDLIAGLGIKNLRYPVLWEKNEPLPGKFDWTWQDRRMARLREMGIAPIAGLVHHGSGPSWTHVLDPEFPAQLANYAASVAQRYPWVKRFTPVNEPQTTARISGLYGLWFPHGRDEPTFLRLVMAQCRAIAAAMKAIRQVNAGAELLQTEDFGRVFSTPPLQYQADHENERRWLAVDLLMGLVTPRHPFHSRMIAAGISGAQLDELAAEPCQPDLIGIDYYLTSDRMLDHRLEMHSGETAGGNGIESYVDIAAVRSGLPGSEHGLGRCIDEVWQRYGVPVVISELHNGCTRDEQLRWFMEGWRTAHAAKQKGIDIRAVTSWSLFGASDWNSMLVNVAGHYECGAFDARWSPPRPTVLARVIAAKGVFDHPVLDQPGWWWRQSAGDAGPPAGDAARPVALAGFGHLLSVVIECCRNRGLRVIPSGSEGDVGHLRERHGAWALIRVEHKGANSICLRASVADETNMPKHLKSDIPVHSEWRAQVDHFLDRLVDAWGTHEPDGLSVSAEPAAYDRLRRRLQT